MEYSHFLVSLALRGRKTDKLRVFLLAGTTTAMKQTSGGISDNFETTCFMSDGIPNNLKTSASPPGRIPNNLKHKTAHLQARTIGIATFVWPAGVLESRAKRRTFRVPAACAFNGPTQPPTGSHGKGHGNGPGHGTVQPLCSRMQPLCSILFFCTLHHIVVSEVHSTRLQKQAEAATWGKGEGAVRRVAQYAFHGRALQAHP